MEVAVFDILGDFAFFKAYETTRGNFSFPFPPRTALIGMLAGILGLDYNSYWIDNPLKDSLLGIEVLNLGSTKGFKMNYTQSRKIMKISDVDIILPKDPSDPDARGFSTPVRLDYFTDVKYRIFFSNDNEQMFNGICDSLEQHRYSFPPYLGHANLLCELIWIGKYNASPPDQSVIDVSCLVPTSAIESDVLVEEGGYTIIYQVPMAYTAKSIKIPEISYETFQIQPSRYENVIFLSGSTIKVNLTRPELSCSISLDDQTKNIIFFPND